VLQHGKLSTGNSLDMTSQDEEHIKANDATVKDMEVRAWRLLNCEIVFKDMVSVFLLNVFLHVLVLQGAAVAYVADLLAIPVISLKAVTDIVDGTKPTVEEFLENMSLAASALSRTVPLVLKYVSGKTVAQLHC
jgi:5'-methylthioadenosine nucleosidase